MRFVSVLFASPLVFAVLAQPKGPVSDHATKLQQIQSLEVTLTLSQGGAVVENHTLTLARPLLARWESEKLLIVSDGSVLYKFNKENQSFTQGPASVEALSAALSADPAWPYAAFFDPKWQEAITQQRMGAQFQKEGRTYQQVVLTRASGVSTVQFDTRSGLARGGSFSRGGRLTSVEVTALKLNTNPAPETFKWSPPPGAAQGGGETQPKQMRFADIQPILNRACASCHGGSRPARGLDLTSHAAVMRSGTVRPGSPGESGLGRAVTRGVMPPNGPLPADEIEKINRWIADGALD